MLNTEFVPCWESVRPVPKVTIDFGNGHLVHRTLTGNTVMYICLPNGEVVDALPGVFTPRDFQLEVGKVLTFMHLLNADKLDSDSKILAWHRGQLDERIQYETILSMGKGFVECPLLDALGMRNSPARLARAIPSSALGSSALSNLPIDKLKSAFQSLCARTDDISHHAMKVEQLKENLKITRVGMSPSPEELGKMVVELDSRNNLHTVHPAVHLLFATFIKPPTPSECSETIYKQLLHVPINDPDLGLADALLPGTH